MAETLRAAVTLLIALQSCSADSPTDHAQSPSFINDSFQIDWRTKKKPEIVSTPLPAVNIYLRAIADNNKIMRGEIDLPNKSKLIFNEHPKDIDIINSEIAFNCSLEKSINLNVAESIGRNTLALVHVAILPRSNTTGIVVAEYEGGATGAREGFVIIRYSPKKCELAALPITDFGKVVISAKSPDELVLWSALSENAGSGVDPRPYTTKSCQWREGGYVCSAPKRQLGLFSPTAISDPGIVVQ